MCIFNRQIAIKRWVINFVEYSILASKGIYPIFQKNKMLKKPIESFTFLLPVDEFANVTAKNLVVVEENAEFQIIAVHHFNEKMEVATKQAVLEIMRLNERYCLIL